MSSKNEIQERLENFAKERDAEIQAELKISEEEAEKYAKKRTVYVNKFSDILKEQGINFDAIISLNSQNDPSLKDEIEQLRNRVKTTSHLPSTRSSSINHLMSHLINDNSSHAIAAEPMIPRLCMIHYQWGEGINSIPCFIVCTDPVRAKVSRFGTGGWGCIQQPQPYPAMIVDWWFDLWPQTPKSAFVVEEMFNGFYVVRAFDGFWDCKNSTVVIDTDISANQNGWQPKSSYPILQDGGDNINKSKRFDENRVFLYTPSVPIQKEVITYLRVTQNFTILPDGDGSYSELNFGEGDANFIPIPSVVAV